MTAPTTATLPDIAATRRALEQRRSALVARRPGLALAAAGGDPTAIEQARQVTSQLADIGLQLQGLDLAEGELQRLDAARQQQAAARAARERAEHVASIRATLGQELAALELLVVDLGVRAGRVDALALEIDQIESSPATPPYRRRYAAVRTLGRIRAALAVWATVPLVGQDPRPLGAQDVV